MIVQGWQAFSPWDSVSFVQNYIELPVFLLLYVVWRVVKRVHSPSLLEIDLDSGRHEDKEEEIQDNERNDTWDKGKWGWAWRAYNAEL